ncbi:scyllo-inositol 2-dehydrogenase (NADP(+)) [Pontiella desulfatans]|uniref:Scyllo-inositol 2-dehydrogenase (NADP(+)) n=1 Tax=Pontiella desulfatans TaxID=2750659 RepID=A0A6C2TYQ9_PONDE|nr:Gfo/Idh/MocA family oxidoreductase [Pontiella desulfatans]VGO12820.1 scyllo-inositol 2-dehydrogenase (NADP(+)) [Pontiella desulfatans]
MKLSRRQMTKAGLLGSAFTFIPGCTTSKSVKYVGANEKVNLAFIGIGGRGDSLSQSFGQIEAVNMVALCDVDMGSEWTAKTEAAFPNARKFKDFRVMFDTMEKDIDAVVVCTPDHSHFPITMASMALGKHVYCEKPLARTFNEIELMMGAADRYGVATQMGNYGHSGANYFQFKAWKEAGIIKDVTHVDAYMNKWRRWHPYGNVKGFPTGEKKPATMNWDVWLGTAQYHEYSKDLHYGNWRGWYDFGTGCFGDWGAHMLDTIQRFLELGLPEKVTAKTLEGQNDFIYPMASTINFAFPARGDMPAMDIDWYDGQENLPPLPKEWGGKELDKNTPGKFIYSKDHVFYGTAHENPLQIIPYEQMRELLKAGKLPRDFGKNSDHFDNFILACKGQEETRTPFAVSGLLSQLLSLGCITQRLGGELEFDRKTKKFTNSKRANELLVDAPPRKGWEQYYKL